MITLDLDNCSDETLKRILRKVSLCGYPIYYRLSPSMNGFHVKIFCVENEKCGKCRLVFDHALRFATDLKRELLKRNVLWDVKYYRKGKHQIALKSGEWVKYEK